MRPLTRRISIRKLACCLSLEQHTAQNPCLTEANYKEMEDKVKAIFNGISDPDLKGTYFPLTGMTKEVQNQLIADHFLFKEGDR